MRSAVLEGVPVDYEKIRKLREKLGITQEAAAKHLGLGTRQSWSHIETGRRADVRVSQLEKIAKLLGVKARDLLK